MGRFGCMMGRFGQCNGPFWTIFLEIKIFGAVLVGAVLAMGRFGIDPLGLPQYTSPSSERLCIFDLHGAIYIVNFFGYIFFTFTNYGK